MFHGLVIFPAFAAKSIGGRFENFIVCRQEHLTILSYSFLNELMSEAGFVNIRTCLPNKETNFPHLRSEGTFLIMNLIPIMIARIR